MNKTEEVKTFYVRVNDWSKERTVEDRGDTVAMEIARIACSHCATCSRRMEYVKSVAGPLAVWEQRMGGYMIVIPFPLEERKNLKEFLERTLKLEIHF